MAGTPGQKREKRPRHVMWQDHLRPCVVFTETSEEFAPYYLAGIRHDIRQTTRPRCTTRFRAPGTWAYGAGRETVPSGSASLGNPSASPLHGTKYGACTVGSSKGGGVTVNERELARGLQGSSSNLHTMGSAMLYDAQS